MGLGEMSVAEMTAIELKTLVQSAVEYSIRQKGVSVKNRDCWLLLLAGHRCQGLGKGHAKDGCSISPMDDWVVLVNP